jgi:predicted O-methyltransferase YrrM
VRRPPYVPSGHYYSPLTSEEDVDRAIAGRRVPAGINLNEEGQVDLLGRLDLAVPEEGRWAREGNTMFGPADASVLQAMIRHFSPQLVVEVGSGYSTAVMLDTAERSVPDLQIRCVEPYADRLRSRLRPGDDARLTLLEEPVQKVDPAELVGDLVANDILFIDSTHVVKAGSDVCHLLLHALPLVASGVLVHVHDVFWPFEYPDDWLLMRRDWTEAYLLQAFLMHNSAWEVLLFNSWVWSERPELVPAGTEHESPGSIWLRRRSS